MKRREIRKEAELMLGGEAAEGERNAGKPLDPDLSRSHWVINHFYRPGCSAAAPSKDFLEGTTLLDLGGP